MSILTPSEVSELIAEVGEVVIFSYLDDFETDGATGEVLNEGTPSNISVYGYPGRYTETQVNGENILANDIRLIVESDIETPQIGWEADIDGNRYRVMDVQKDRMGGVTCNYVCQLRAR